MIVVMMTKSESLLPSAATISAALRGLPALPLFV